MLQRIHDVTAFDHVDHTDLDQCLDRLVKQYLILFQINIMHMI